MFVEPNGDDLLVIVTVSGPPGSGTSTLVKRIVEEYSWKSLNGGDIFRSEAHRRGLTVGQFSDLCKEDLDVDRSLDSILKRELQDTKGSEIIESRLSGWWAHMMGIDCLRIWVDVSPEECARRIQNREGGDFETQLLDRLVPYLQLGPEAGRPDLKKRANASSPRSVAPMATSKLGE